MLPIAAGIMLTAPISAPLAQRFGSKLVVLGLMILAAGIGTVSRATMTSSYGLVALAMSLGGLGMGLVVTPATDSVMGAVPRENAGVGSAMNDTTREVGGALGVAAMGNVLAAGFGGSIAGSPARQALQLAASHAFLHGMAAALTGAAVALAAAVLVLVLLPSFEPVATAEPELASAPVLHEQVALQELP
jgi:MFS family permease